MIRLSLTVHIDCEVLAGVDTDQEAMKLAQALVAERYPGAVVDYRSLETVDDDATLTPGTARFKE